MSSALRVLVTGAYGLIGNAIYARLAQNPQAYDVYALARRHAISDRLPATAAHPIPDEKVYVANVTDYEAVQQAVKGMDVVIHLAANPNGDASWDSILQNNIMGTYNVFEASRQAGVKRIVYASTMQVLWGYQHDEPYHTIWTGHYEDVPPASITPVTHLQPTRPMNYYASSKVWGEGLAHVYAYTRNISCLVVRIGWVSLPEPPPEPAAAGTWCSIRDITQLLEKCAGAPESLRFDIFHGLSNNAHNVADISHAREMVGYAPLDAWPIAKS